MSQREAWGAALIVAASFAGWGGATIEAVARAAKSQHLVLYVVVSVASIGAFLVVIALLTGVAGLIFLIPALIARIHRRKLRLVICWITGVAAAAAAPYLALLVFFAILTAAMSGDYVRVEAEGGQSVLLAQDPFDGDTVDIYTPYDDTHYRWTRSAPELAGWPRVEDQDCRLEAAGEDLQLTCGDSAVAIMLASPSGAVPPVPRVQPAMVDDLDGKPFRRAVPGLRVRN